jgi:hypothetical protein
MGINVICAVTPAKAGVHRNDLTPGIQYLGHPREGGGPPVDSRLRMNDVIFEGAKNDRTY